MGYYIYIRCYCFSNSFLLCLFEKLEPALPDKNCKGTKENIGHRTLKWIRPISSFEPFLSIFNLIWCNKPLLVKFFWGETVKVADFAYYCRIYRQNNFPIKEGDPLSRKKCLEKIRKIRITTDTSGQAKVPPTVWGPARSQSAKSEVTTNCLRTYSKL